MSVNYEALKQMRVDRRIYLHEMAEALGLQTPGGYSRIETGENELRAKHLPLIARRFGMSLVDFTTKIFDEELEQSSNSEAMKEVI